MQYFGGRTRRLSFVIRKRSRSITQSTKRVLVLLCRDFVVPLSARSTFQRASSANEAAESF